MLNSLPSLVLMQLLGFIGVLVMFLFVIRSLSNQNALIRDSIRQYQGSMVNLERQLIDLHTKLRRQQSTESLSTTESQGISAEVLDEVGLRNDTLPTLFGPESSAFSKLPTQNDNGLDIKLEL